MYSDKDVVCIWTGTGSRFTPHYVEKLRNMVENNTNRKYNFFCLLPETDFDLLPDSIAKIALPEPFLEPRGWNMVHLFKGYQNLSNDLVYFDLDTVIVDNIQFLFDLDTRFAVLEDFGPGRPLFGGAVMLWRQTDYLWVYDEFNKSVMKDNKFRGRADLWYGYLIQSKNFNIDWLQDIFPKKFASYKIDLDRGDIKQDTAVVCFHGEPLPHEVKNKWVKRYWK